MTLNAFRPDFANAIDGTLSNLVNAGATVHFAVPLRRVESGYLPTGICVSGVPFSDAMKLSDCVAPFETEEHPISVLAKEPTVRDGWEVYG